MDCKLNKQIKLFKYLAQQKLQAILSSIPNPKKIILDPCIIKTLEHICSASWIKARGIEKIFRFSQKTPPPKDENHDVYIIHSNVLILKLVLDQIHSQKKQKSGIKKFHIIFVPDIYESFRVLIEEEGLLGYCHCYRFNWNFICLDDGLLTLEYPNFFDELYFKHDSSLLNAVAHSLRTFNIVFGKPEISMCVGEKAVKIMGIMCDLKKSKPWTSEKLNKSSALLVLDRSEDFTSCLLSPATYSSLLHEVFKCSSGILESQLNKLPERDEKKFEIFTNRSKINLNEEFSKSNITLRMSGKHDKIYKENRYKHFAAASKSIQIHSKSLGAELQNLSKMRVNEIQNYVAKKLPETTLLKSKISKHMSLCEVIIEELAKNFQKRQQLEEKILNGTNRKNILDKIMENLITGRQQIKSLRLLCLFHTCLELNSEELNSFVQNFCNIFGYKYLSTFKNLSHCRLLPKINFVGTEKNKILGAMKKQETEFQMKSNRLKLVPSITLEHEMSNINCPSFVFNGLYIPLIAQLSSIILKSGSINEVCLKLGTIIEQITCFVGNQESSINLKTFQFECRKGNIEDPFPIKHTLFVFVIGGISFAEIAACDFISKNFGSKIVLLSNSIITGNDIILAA